MIEHRGVDVVQPDLFYFGGFVRSIRVARMAAAAGMPCTPHMSGGGLGYLYVAHFASCVPNAGPYQEFKGTDDSLPVTSDIVTAHERRRHPEGADRSGPRRDDRSGVREEGDDRELRRKCQ